MKLTPSRRTVCRVLWRDWRKICDHGSIEGRWPGRGRLCNTTELFALCTRVAAWPGVGWLGVQSHVCWCVQDYGSRGLSDDSHRQAIRIIIIIFKQLARLWPAGVRQDAGKMPGAKQADISDRWPAVPIEPNYRLGRSKNHSFLLPKKVFSGSKYPKTISYNFDNSSTAGHPDKYLLTPFSDLNLIGSALVLCHGTSCTGFPCFGRQIKKTHEFYRWSHYGVYLCFLASWFPREESPMTSRSMPRSNEMTYEVFVWSGVWGPLSRTVVLPWLCHQGPLQSHNPVCCGSINFFYYPVSEFVEFLQPCFIFLTFCVPGFHSRILPLLPQCVVVTQYFWVCGPYTSTSRKFIWVVFLVSIDRSRRGDCLISTFVQFCWVQLDTWITIHKVPLLLEVRKGFSVKHQFIGGWLSICPICILSSVAKNISWLDNLCFVEPGYEPQQ